MFWKYSRTETKQLLVVTLLLFSACTLFIGESWRRNIELEALTANTVGIYVGVEENEINKLASELDARERELDAREMALVRESNFTNDKKTLVFLIMTGAGLLGLILLNFFLDAKRRASISG